MPVFLTFCDMGLIQLNVASQAEIRALTTF
jgi:hypothetical protein